MSIGFLITGRMKSTRLPNKLIQEINGKQIIRHMIDRLKTSEIIDKIVLCTSTNSQDDILETIAKEEKIEIYRGSEEDVVERLHEACQKFQFEFVFNITADCPLVSIEYLPIIYNKFLETSGDFIRALDLPHGFFSYGIKVSALKKICEIKKSNETEVWGKYFTDSGLFKVIDIEIPKKLIRPHYRLTLDYIEDFELLKHIFEHFGNKIYQTKMPDIIQFLDLNPELPIINANCIEKFQKRWDSQNNMKL